MRTDDVVAWLLSGNPWTRYRTQIDLLGLSETQSEVASSREAMINHPLVRNLVSELSQWPGAVLRSHKDANHPLHKLTFLADLGIPADDPGLQSTLEKIIAHQATEGPFQVLINIPAHFGGTGKDEWNWMLCDAPLLVYALAKLGFVDDPRLMQAVGYLLERVRDNGWPCASAPALGKFRGPGRKDDPCPYANLAMLKALSVTEKWRAHPAVPLGAEALLNLWVQRATKKPYLFGMGTDFLKLKAPLIWYDLLHVLDVLTCFPGLKTDPRLLEMVDILKSKARSDGRFMAESIWLAWKEWDFGQKREPSPWLTLVAHRILKRLEQ
ncbi:MAG: hypothetical protein ONB16_10450 [candidate division KSB1 bacterium]|nr:hypothetical protein [candidate division KSB1 bacterium]MDZ7318155.1 hypothetical protein [candidate division KSB1 bacterium]MDZ7342392.1 hypothetical protein [candidate division KSB1 bacterium]